MDKNINYYAEFGTDKYIIENYFLNKNDGIMVEVGAARPDQISTSKAFKEKGWRCINVEPNPYFAEEHRKIGNEIYEVALSNEAKDNVIFDICRNPLFKNEKTEGMCWSAIAGKFQYKLPMDWVPYTEKVKVKVITLNQLLESLNITQLDFVSIDVEGWELEVMQGFDTYKYKPKIIVLENLDHVPSYHEYMRAINYRYVKYLQQNEIYELID